MKQLRAHPRMGGAFVAFLMLIAIFHGGCATSEETKQKSTGYYQEGMASLERDRQKAYVSFQKAVQLDPKNKEARLVVVDVAARRTLPQPIGLDEIKNQPALKDFDLVRLPRLSVMPVSEKQWEAILALAKR